MGKTIKHTEELTLEIDVDEFKKYVIPLVEDINDKIENELMHTACGIINGTQNPEYTWQGMFYRSMVERGYCEFTELGKDVFSF